MGQERKYIIHRKVPRREFYSSVGILIHGIYEINQAFEIGERGMLIQTPRRLQEGELVVVTFNISGLLNTVVRGVVRYSIPKDPQEGALTKYGLEFQNIDFQSKRQIRKYVAARKQLGSFSEQKPQSF